MAESGYELQDVVSQRAAEAAHLVRLFILIPLVLVLLPPLIELVLLLSAIVTLENSAKHLADMAAVGASPSVIAAEIGAVGWGVDGSSVQAGVLRQSCGGAEAGSTGWLHLAPVAGCNDAQPGDRLHVRLCYEHRLLFGSLLASVFGASDDGFVPIEAAAESIRE